MTNVKLNLRDLLVRELGGTTTLIPATIDIDELLEFSDIHEVDQDIGELLATLKMIGIIWRISDVKSRRPDLSDDQCWDVLQALNRQHNREHGITWDTIDATSETLFGDGNQHRVGRCELALMDYGSDDDPDTCLIDFLTDAMHWCRGRPSAFADALRIAEDHFSHETHE